MGIKGLIPLLKPIQKDIHIKEYAGQTVAVDGHCWLHRGSFGCASLLARGVPTKAYVTYFMHMVNMLLFNRVTPIIVFDGQRLPIKSVTNEARSKLRKEKRELGLSLFDKKRVGEAEKCFQQAISITPAMVANVIEELDKLNVQHIVSPYEADPQLTFLVKSGLASAVITEDSDLLAFGASRVIVKMDRFGQGTQVVHTDMFSNALCMRHFTPETFRYVCILSGCDYLSSLPGIGLKKAQDIVRRGQNTPRIFLALLRTHAMDEVEEYKEEYLKADAAFLYQFVFDPASRTYKRLNPLPKDIKVDHLVGLGESPQNRSVDILKSNGAIHLDTADYTKENDDVSRTV
ncbi:PIN domain-like protein [Mucor mucedo]|uniref:PIN domain-like protein n=1 Tax=Mucor mucedo TaxID=29922 RepID=UPI0022201687|nr:PIN domain-like protein [Mucor mucedo]KAI7892724.1 PIN domain-like protein [Mucor mucedo]